ncbi:MAG: quinone-dependent dihydroorotate dehydrogenase [Sterolibacteriaceae bacterium MAG5]|nr:quinone-dependent dihydroorotate dehydrogenase [Candidatus Nitricoxidireducens bremensis]
MIPYCLLKPIVFALDPETAHETAIAGMRTLGRAGLAPAYRPHADKPVTVMGLDFPNRIGLAAGLDKNGEAIDALAAWGFGSLEIGTVTPRPQPGNPKPRLFRLPAAKGIINRMGFNNHGVDALLANVKAAKYRGILGINIGKNFDTPIEKAADDYLIGLEKVYAHAGYVTVNISSPNTKNLRQLQGESELDALLGALKAKQTELADRHGRYVPITLKIAPDLDDAQIANIADAVRRHRFDALIATNTTLSRDGVENLPHGQETGGLSGLPVFEKSTAVLRAFVQALAGELPVIAAGGVVDGAKAKAKLDAGAALVQVYSGLIYRGPELVKECVAATRAG